MRSPSSRRHADIAAPRPMETIQSALAGEPKAVSSLLQIGWTLWISPAILQGKRGVVELRHQSAEGRERYSLPVLTFLTLRDEGTIIPQPGSDEDLWVRCTLSERMLSTSSQDEKSIAQQSVASSAA